MEIVIGWIIGIGVLLGFCYWAIQEDKAEERRMEARIDREFREERSSKINALKGPLEAIMDKRFNTLVTDDYLRVKYKLKGCSDDDLKSLSIMPKAHFFPLWYFKIRDDLDEFSRQVRAGRISDYTHDLLKYVATCNYNCYPNGRYNSYYEDDEIIYYGKYTLEPIEKNLLEG